MASAYQHSVYLEEQKCTGCTTCLHHCPTEAIRILDGKAVINSDRCIDCGECIRRCPHQAKKAMSSPLSSMDRFRWKIALPAPTLYGQFDNLDDVDYVLNGLKKIGFDEVYEVSAGAEIVSAYTRQYIKTEGVRLPLISSACPVVIRLICLLFPSLKDNVMRLLPPMEVAAQIARIRAMSAHPELEPQDIGVCFVSPCPGKVSYVKNNTADTYNSVDEVVSINDVYFELVNAMKRGEEIESLSDSGMLGIGWASSGGESAAILNDDYLAADGIENVIHVLNQIENGNIQNVKFIELNACPGGCVGGVLSVQNPFIAKARLQSLRHYLPVSMLHLSQEEQHYIPANFFFEELPKYNPVARLSNNMAESMRMMADIQRIRAQLPGIDCGACGAPSCRAHAEDLVRSRKKNPDVDCPILRAKMIKDPQ
ncbi:MAG: 4Fe-4S dicluster domain-containing protein [Lachnospiraceae bacterium]|nr:4Fe-4S dicluster domain-containing protein [Lachnospiraceae bacterium]